MQAMKRKHVTQETNQHESKHRADHNAQKNQIRFALGKSLTSIYPPLRHPKPPIEIGIPLKKALKPLMLKYYKIKTSNRHQKAKA
jgi:hypothetical protein